MHWSEGVNFSMCGHRCIPNLCSGAIELVCGGSPIACVLVESKPQHSGKREQQQHRTTADEGLGFDEMNNAEAVVSSADMQKLGAVCRTASRTSGLLKIGTSAGLLSYTVSLFWAVLFLCHCCLLNVLILKEQMTRHYKKATRNLISVYFHQTDPLSWQIVSFSLHNFPTHRL